MAEPLHVSPRVVRHATGSLCLPTGIAAYWDSLSEHAQNVRLGARPDGL